MSIKKRASRWLNLLVTGEPCTLCATAWHRQWGIRHTIDRIFGRHHCLNNYEYERLHNKKYSDYLYSLVTVNQIPPVYRCVECQRVTEHPTRVTRIVSNKVRNMEFCDNECADAFTDKLREAGL